MCMCVSIDGQIHPVIGKDIGYNTRVHGLGEVRVDRGLWLFMK